MKYPAHLVPFEKLMYFLDQPSFPNSLGIRLRFDGQINRAAALAAAEVAFGRHPGFQVIVDRERLRFVDNEEPFRNFRWIELSSADEAHPMQPTDVHRDGGGMFWFVAAPGGCSVALIGNHTLTDGVGGLQVISDWLLEYHRVITGGKPSLSKLSPERLALRGRLNLLNRKFLSKLLFQPIALFGASKFLFRRTVPLLSHSGNEVVIEPPSTYPNILTRRLSVSQTDRIKVLATECAGTPNDILAGALFVAIARWRKRHSHQNERDWIRLLIPLSIRTMADRRLTACNRVSMVQVDRQPRQMIDTGALLASVSRELRVIRQWQLDRTLLLALRLSSLVPGQLRRMARNPRNRATSLLTNLGNPFDRLPLPKDDHSILVGNLKLFGVELVAPMLRGVPIALAVAEFLKQWTICLNFDARLVAAKQAGEFLDEFERAIGELIDEDYNKES